MSELEL
jgi:chromosome segregation ATPase